MKIKVKVKTNVKENRVEKIAENSYIVFVKEAAIKGKANKEIIKLLAEEFNISYKSIIIKNPKSRSKIVEIKKDEI